jgi:hypothetical protein
LTSRSAESASGAGEDPPELFEGEAAAELAGIDDALERATSATSRETALAALATATAGINAYGSRQVVAVSDTPVASPGGDRATLTQAYFMYVRSPVARGSRPGGAASDRKSNIESRLEKYWNAAQSVVTKFHPSEYQISLGFPQLISVSFTWKVPNP